MSELDVKVERIPANTRCVLFLARGGVLDGAERQLCYLAAGLDRKLFDPLVLLDRDGPMTAHLRSLGVPTQVVPMRAWRSFPSALFRYLDASRMTRFADRHRVAIVHASDLWKSGYARFIARRLGVPCVIHVRGPVTKADAAKHGLSKAAGIIAIAQRY